MIHPHTRLQFISEEIGHGVVATRLIPAGTITWVLDDLDREISKDAYKRMSPIYKEVLDTYSYRNSKGNYILCWDHGRFVNHSFNANCLSTAYDFEIAIRDIQPGEQLTDDYGYLNIQEPFRAKDEGTKRKVVYPDDLVRYHQLWDKQLIKVFGKIVEQEQPLRPLLSDTTWKKIRDITNGKAIMDSILDIYYNEGLEHK